MKTFKTTISDLSWKHLVRTLGVLTGLVTIAGMLLLYLQTLGAAIEGRISIVPFVTSIPLLLLFGILLLIPVRIIKSNRWLKFTYGGLATFFIIRILLGPISELVRDHRLSFWKVLFTLAVAVVIALHIKLIATANQNTHSITASGGSE